MNSFVQRGFGFLGWSYPGYEYSEGYPSEQGLYEGLRAISDYLVSTYDIQPSDQIAMGHSLGGLVTVDAAEPARPIAFTFKDKPLLELVPVIFVSARFP